MKTIKGDLIMEEETKKFLKSKRFLFGLLIVFFFAFLTSVFAFDSEIYQSCGGDSELIIGCLGDHELYFQGGDSISPTVSLNSPEDNTQDQDGIVRFIFTPDDDNDLESCSLKYGNKIYTTTSTVSRDIQNIIEVVDIEQNHPLYSDDLQWSISCADEFENIGTSENRHLDTKSDVIGGEGSIGTQTSDKNPLRINLIYDKSWIKGESKRIEIQTINLNGIKYLPMNISIEINDSNILFLDRIITNESNIFIYRVMNNAEIGERNFKIKIEDERQVIQIIGIIVEENKTQISDGGIDKESFFKKYILFVYIILGILFLVVIGGGIIWDKKRKAKA